MAPADVGSCDVEPGWAGLLMGILRLCGGGAPCLERWNAFILACMSCGRPPPLADRDGGGGPGLRAALTAPSGFDDADIVVVASTEVRKAGSLGGEGLGGDVDGTGGRALGGDDGMLASDGCSGERGTVSGVLMAAVELGGKQGRWRAEHVGQWCENMSSQEIWEDEGSIQ